MIYDKKDITYKSVKAPKAEFRAMPVDLTDETMDERRRKILKLMQGEQLDALVIYADREHGANFEYLTGFVPRFEEALFVLHKNGAAYILLGNEMYHMYEHSRTKADGIHVPYFSLPNQPMENKEGLTKLLAKAEIKEGMNIGLVGWKMFTSRYEDNKKLFDMPHYVVEALKSLIGETGTMQNACDLFIHPKYGARTTVNANEIAHYEFGAALASDCMLNLLEHIEPGKTELEMGSYLNAYGQPGSVQTICAVGERFTNAVVAPRNKKLERGEKFSATVGYIGGLTNRAGYLVHDESELNGDVRDYLERVVKPYYAAVATWYCTVGIGVTGGELYGAVNASAPKEVYGWVLNPGHLTGFEEWLSSSVEEGSDIPIKSGNMLQMDIIFKVPGFGGTNAEDGIAVADEALRGELEKNYPETWNRIQRRRNFMEHELGISLKPEILPLSNSEGYLRPFLLNADKAMCITKGGAER